MVLCKETDFAFGIGSGDTITFQDSNGQELVKTILAGDGVEDVTWSRILDATGSLYRTPASAGALNTPVVVNEIADKGSDGVCEGADWIELYNPSDKVIALDKHMLCDNKGCGDEDAYTFPTGTTIGQNQYLVLCKGGAAFRFGHLPF